MNNGAYVIEQQNYGARLYLQLMFMRLIGMSSWGCHFHLFSNGKQKIEGIIYFLQIKFKINFHTLIIDMIFNSYSVFIIF
jgi:hypothetical protein